MHLFVWLFYVSLGINLVMFAPAFIFQTDKLTDVSYALTFIVVALAGYAESTKTTVHTMTLILVLLWALRLGTFLFIRINKMKKDRRFDGMRNKFFSFLKFWVLQGVTVYVVMLSAIGVWNQKTTTLTALSVLGGAVFLAGLILETVADAQKYKFNTNKKTDTWIHSGVWSVSRHPNYLGEMMVWLGVYLYVFSSLHGNARLVGLLSPIYIIVLLLFVSGIPLLEKSANKKWGSDPAYKKYIKQTPALIPTWKSMSGNK